MLRTYRLMLSLLALMVPTSLHAGTAVVVQPTSASGQHTIIGTDIFLPAGPQRVRFEVRIAGWGDEQLKTVQVKLDTSGFAAGSPPLTRTTIACPSNNSAGHNFCATQLEPGSRCTSGCAPGSTVGCSCDWIFQTTTRTDYAGFGLLHISAVDPAEDPRLGFTLQPFDYVEDLGVSFYLGTFFVEVPAQAQGIYTVDIIHSLVESETFMQNYDLEDSNIPIDLHAGARLIIGPAEPPASRTLRYRPDAAATPTAVRVRVDSLYHPGPPVAEGEDRDLSAAEGAIYWLGPPSMVTDPASGISHWTAPLQCAPHYADWDALGEVFVYGDPVIPSSEYRFNEVPIECEDPTDPICFGPPQNLHTGQWGDVAAPFGRSDQPAQPDMADIAALIGAWRGVPNSLPAPFMQLYGPLPELSFLDIRLAVDAMSGTAYPYPVPTICP